MKNRKNQLKMTLISTSKKSNVDFARSIRSAVRGAWKSEIDFFSFMDAVFGAVHRGYERAWREGAAICGITPQERTADEWSVLNREIMIAQGRIAPFADYVFSRQKVDGFLLRQVMGRAEVWSNSYNRIVTLARSTSCADRKFIWVLGPTRDHCTDCANYSGRIHRGSVWRSVGAHPQSRRLECGGWRCLCSLVPTDQPATPGRPPRPSG